MDRRDFIKSSVASGTAVSLSSSLSCQKDKSVVEKGIPKRRLGRTGEMLSIIGFGGIVVSKVEQEIANEAVSKAFDRGVNYFDVAPTYGNAEEKLGPALEPYRSKSFLACKTAKRKKSEAEKELHQSLKYLRTDYFDLYQLHNLSKVEDVETAFGPSGAMEVFLKAKEEGKARYLGFSAHSEEAALLALDKFDFDTALFPINFVCWHQGNFGSNLLQKAKERNMGILALKALAYTTIPKGEEKPYKKCWYRPIPFEEESMLDLALRFTMSQSTTAAIPPGEPEYFWKALDLVPDLAPLTAEDENIIKSLAQGIEPLFKSV
jgi:predicted aldo/keto reductase-like oxidoreductase